MSKKTLFFQKTTTLFQQVIHNLKGSFLQLKVQFSTNPRPLLALLLFYLLLFIFPSNLAKHFIFGESYVRGLLIDYLVPTIYLVELVALAFLLLNPWKKPSSRLFLSLIFLFLLSLVPSAAVGLASPLWLISVTRFFELALWLLFGWWVAENIGWNERRKVFAFLGLGVVWVSLLALGQFFLQREIFGYWFLGEPLLSQMGGLAKTSLGGVEYLRSYGTFPHPNVLGGVLSVLLLWFISAKAWGPLLTGALGLVVSFSRLAAFSFLGGLLGFALGASLITSHLSLLTLPSDFDDLSVSRRISLLQSAWAMFQTAPATGVGLGTFTANLPDFELPPGPTLFLQPVHNIFALVAAESGIFAFLAFLLLIASAFFETIKKKRWLLTISILQLVFLGFFDHYLYTLPQGLFLLSLTLGLSFARDSA
ncbi:hypothetical protein A2797_01435 [candidate division WWE3 bacterium RIFCSPHIGHO2_01_FULL_48_15]|uniref:O-antigen ligase-related domain-containing protein n=1 Tax=candidate division WWE3 bacterium RIFCSPHIGHO2_01_FULL_48_15 TaxID=1802619 RepID=A0A1F4VDF5_UNCKA|nr:MAG: hypothetical protein A2797_01435 [candidate division WWE3 bacterium RIFCSPHIGHO2_01_FULL_48_15]